MIEIPESQQKINEQELER